MRQESLEAHAAEQPETTANGGGVKVTVDPKTKKLVVHWFDAGGAVAVGDGFDAAGTLWAADEGEEPPETWSNGGGGFAVVDPRKGKLVVWFGGLAAPPEATAE